MVTLVIYTAFVALSAAFILALVRKWGWLEWLQVHSNGFFHKLLSCQFCTTFWMTVAVSCGIVIVSGFLPALLCPIFATPIAVRLW